MGRAFFDFSKLVDVSVHLSEDGYSFLIDSKSPFIKMVTDCYYGVYQTDFLYAALRIVEKSLDEPDLMLLSLPEVEKASDKHIYYNVQMMRHISFIHNRIGFYQFSINNTSPNGFRHYISLRCILEYPDTLFFNVLHLQDVEKVRIVRDFSSLPSYSHDFWGVEKFCNDQISHLKPKKPNLKTFQSLINSRATFPSIQIAFAVSRVTKQSFVTDITHYPISFTKPKITFRTSDIAESFNGSRKSYFVNGLTNHEIKTLPSIKASEKNKGMKSFDRVMDKVITEGYPMFAFEITDTGTRRFYYGGWRSFFLTVNGVSGHEVVSDMLGNVSKYMHEYIIPGMPVKCFGDLELEFDMNPNKSMEDAERMLWTSVDLFCWAHQRVYKDRLSRDDFLILDSSRPGKASFHFVTPRHMYVNTLALLPVVKMAYDECERVLQLGKTNASQMTERDNSILELYITWRKEKTTGETLFTWFIDFRVYKCGVQPMRSLFSAKVNKQSGHLRIWSKSENDITGYHDSYIQFKASLVHCPLEEYPDNIADTFYNLTFSPENPLPHARVTYVSDGTQVLISGFSWGSLESSSSASVSESKGVKRKLRNSDTNVSVSSQKLILYLKKQSGMKRFVDFLDINSINFNLKNLTDRSGKLRSVIYFGIQGTKVYCHIGKRTHTKCPVYFRIQKDRLYWNCYQRCHSCEGGKKTNGSSMRPYIVARKIPYEILNPIVNQ
jgi:hypothetical protein